MSYINQVIIFQCDSPSLHYCTLPKKVFFSPLVWARRECFFIGVALKLAVLVSWYNSLRQCPLANLLNSLRKNWVTLVSVNSKCTIHQSKQKPIV